MKTSAKENGLEVKVGLFVCVGLAIIGAMILEFSLGGKQGFKSYYSLHLDLPNAAGLLKGSEVLLAGSNVGYVADKPVLSPSLGTVRATLKIDQKIKIPKGSIFKVDSSGLLGDKFVSVQTGPGFDPNKFNREDPAQSYQPGDVILGAHTPDLAEIAQEVNKKLNDALDSFKVIVDNVNNGILSPANQQKLVDSFGSIKTTTDNLAKASQDIGPIVKNAGVAVDKANETMATVHDAAENLRGTLETARNLMEKASKGDGLIAQLINNRQLADNFNSLVINLREHGILFYHNTAKPAPPVASPAPARERNQH